MTPTPAALLAFERQRWQWAGAKERAVMDMFGLSATRYYQVLLRAAHDPEGIATHPDVAARVRRMAEDSP